MKKRRLLAALLTLAMVLGIAPTVAMADGGAPHQAIQLGTGDLDGAGQDYIFFATNTKNRDEAICWRILDAEKTNTNKDGMFLLSESVLQYASFAGDKTAKDPTLRDWATSAAKTWCGELFSSWNTLEQAAVLLTTKEETTDYISTSRPGFTYSGASLNNDTLFYLSVEEAETAKYGFTDNDSRSASPAGYGDYKLSYYLRSPLKSVFGKEINNMVAQVNNMYGTQPAGSIEGYWVGTFTDEEGTYTDKNGVRPAFNLDKSKVLLVSPAMGGKTAELGLNEVTTTNTTEWKLTLLDSSRNFAVTEDKATVKPGADFTLHYTGATVNETESAPNEYISAVIVDTNDVVKYYGRIAKPTSTQGEVNITLPAALADGSYKLKVFSEQCNGDQATDYASELDEVALTVDSRPAAPTITPNGGKITGETQVTITAEDGAIIYYTTDGSDPTDTSADSTRQEYTAPFSVEPVTTVKAVAVKGGLTSEVTTATFEKKTSSGGGGGGGGGSSTTTTTNTTTVEKAEHGKVTVSPEKAAKGETVTVTATPDEGYQLDKVTVLDKNGDKVELETVKEGEKYTFKMPETKVTVTATFTEAKADEKTDEGKTVDVSNVFNTKEHDAYAFGYDDGKVHPEDTVTRAQTAAMLYRLLTAEVKAAIAADDNSFADVAADSWYNEAVSCMTNGGYLYGYPEGNFGAEDAITRAQFAAIIVRMTGAETVFGNSFADVANNHWAKDAINTAAENGWVKGVGDGKFDPERKLTRAEAMAIINRVLNRGVDANGLTADVKQWTDNAVDAWYYYDVLEATNGHLYTGSRPSEIWTGLQNSAE